MNTFGHCLLSQKKFGGLPEDYKKVHYLIDCSKYYFFHAKHRACLHNTYGIMLAEQLFGEFLMNSDGHKIAIRTIAEEHCREDLNGYVPSLEDFWQDNLHLAKQLPAILPSLGNTEWDNFLQKPYQLSGIKATLGITYSNLGVRLLHYFYGETAAQTLEAVFAVLPTIKDFLHSFKFTASWQTTLNPVDYDWLKNYYNQNPASEEEGKRWLVNLYNLK